MLNLKNNPIPIFYLHRQLILEEFDLSALALTPKEKEREEEACQGLIYRRRQGASSKRY